MEIQMIDGGNITVLTALVIGLVGLGMVLDRTPVGKHVPSAVTIMVIAILLSNFGVTPFASPVYDIVLGQLVPVGIILLLLQTRLRVILVEARPVLLSFFIAIIATLIGVACAVFIVDFGGIEAAVAGVFAGTYIGGAMNFVAISHVVGFTDPDLYASALAADTAVGATFFIGLILLSTLVRGFTGEKVAVAPEPQEETQSLQEQGPGRLLLVIAGAFLVSWASSPIAAALSISQFSILVMTFAAIAAANIFPNQIRNTAGVEQAGMAVMYAFFIAVGFGADMASLSGPALKFVYFATIILAVHIAILILCWRLFRLPLKELLIASNACVLGPATAAGMAASRGWSNLITPGLFAGVLGYAIANFIGTGVAMMLGWRG
jgi:uncharacterized membrane protein